MGSPLHHCIAYIRMLNSASFYLYALYIQELLHQDQVKLSQPMHLNYRAMLSLKCAA